MTHQTKEETAKKEITIAIGSRENALEDIHTLARERVENPEVVMIGPKEARERVREFASALFLDAGLVLVLVEPEKELIHDLKKQLHTLAERVHVILYLTSALTDGHKPIEGKVVVLEQKKERRIEDRVRAFIRKYGKKMTHQALQLLTARIKDESVLDTELMKLVTYVGERTDIKSRDILAIGTETHEDSLITLFDAFARKDKEAALGIFQNLLDNGLPILAIHSFLTRQIRLLLHAKDMEEVFAASPEYPVFSKTFAKWKDVMDMKPSEKKHYLPFQKPYYAFNLSKTSGKISRQDLIAFFDMLADLDLSIKSGAKNERTRLEEGLIG